MSEQGLSPENSPVVAGPDADTGTAEQNSQPEIDWQKRYVDTQEAYTRGQQEISDLRRRDQLYETLVSSDDPETRRQAALELGFQLEEEAPAEEYEDPFATYDRRLDSLETSIAQRQQEEADAAYAREVRAVVDERLGQLELDKDDQDWVLAYAINALPITDEGLPDIQQAYEVFTARETARQKAWAQTKRAPHVSPVGQQATEVPNLDNDQQRRDWMVAQLQANEQ
jgi:hypothetical protein